jgi:hypothetical protein
MKDDLSDHTYEQIGRITVAATRLEYILANFAAEVLREDADALISTTGRPRARAIVAVESLTEDELYPLLREWIDFAGQQLDDRNKVVHAIWQVVGVAQDGTSLLLTGEHTRSGSVVRTESEMMEVLPARLEMAAVRGFQLLHRFFRKPGQPEPEIDLARTGRIVTYAPGVAQKLFSGPEWVWTMSDSEHPISPPSH